MSKQTTQAILALGKIERRDDELKGSKSSKFYSLAMFALLVAALLIVMFFATMIYGAVNDVRIVQDDRRAALGVISNAIRQNDSSGFVASQQGPEGDALVLVEHTDGGNYETRFYLYDGNLCQEYVKEGARISPDEATVIAPMRSFEFKHSGSLIKVSTDSGEVYVAVRSEVNPEKHPDDASGEYGGAVTNEQ